MKSERLAGRTAVVVTVGCVTLVALTVVALAEPSFRKALGFGRVSPSYVNGQQIALPASAYDQAPLSLILFARSDCSACRAAEPFVKDLAARATPESGLQVRVAMDAGEKEPAKIAFLQALGFDRRSLLNLDLSNVRITNVPTLILVDRRGVVQGDWEPPLPRAEIVQALAARLSPR